MSLTKAQIRQLRGLANTMKPVIIIGKDDVTAAIVQRADEYLEAHELMKCSVIDGSSLTAQKAAEILAMRAHAELVQVIGHKFVLYRHTTRKGVKQIQLVQE